MYEEILYEVDEPVATISFNRPDRLNALTYRTQIELKHAFAQAEQEERAVGIILTGVGRGFSAGADMQSLGQIASQGRMDGDDGLEKLKANPGGKDADPEFKVTWGFIPGIRKPVIAAINGPCAGMSFVIAALCDIRFAAESAKFTTSFSQRGLIAEHGVSWILPRLVGPSRALDLLWTARKFDAAEAERLGFVDRVLPDDELLPAARAYIEDLAQNCSPTSLMTMKRQLYLHLHRPLHEAIEESNRLMGESLRREDFKEGVASFVEKRPPNFKRAQID